MPKTASVVFVAVLLLASFASALPAGQSLGELARKERERRDENKAQGVVTHAFAEGEIFEEEEETDAEEGDDVAGESDSDSVGDPVGDESRSSVGLDAALNDPESTTPSASREEESRDRKRREADFRGRYQAAKQRVAAAQERQQTLDGLHVVEGVRYVDEHGNTVIESLDHLRRLIQETEQERQAAVEAVTALEEEARRQSYPKGWLR